MGFAAGLGGGVGVNEISAAAKWPAAAIVGQARLSIDASVGLRRDVVKLPHAGRGDVHALAKLRRPHAVRIDVDADRRSILLWLLIRHPPLTRGADCDVAEVASAGSRKALQLGERPDRAV